MRKIFLFQLLILLSLNVYGGTSLTVEGRLTDATGIIPVSEADVDFTFKVYSADGTCLIYEEDHNNVDMSGSLGYFNLKLGSGSYIQGATYLNAMNNGLASISGVSCTYNPIIGDERKLEIVFNANDGSGEQTLSQLIEIGSSHNANQANQLNASANLNLRSFKIVNLADPTTAQDAATKNYVDASISTAIASVAADITGVTAGTGLTGGATAGDATLSVDVGTGPNQIVQLDGSGALPALDGANLTNITTTLAASSVGSSEITDGAITATDLANSSVTTAKLNDGAVTSSKLGITCTSNQVLKHNGSAWACGTDASGGTGDFLADGTVAMTGHLNMGGNNITNAGTLTVSGGMTSTGGIATNTLNSSGNVNITGNVGIGVAPTSTPLTVQGAGNEPLHVVSTSSNGPAIHLNGPTAAYSGFFGSAKSTLGGAFLAADTAIATSAGTDIIFGHLGGTERMRIDEFGNVGIGVASPSAKLSVVETSTDSTVHATESLLTYQPSASSGSVAASSYNMLSFNGTDGAQNLGATFSQLSLSGTSSADVSRRIAATHSLTSANSSNTFAFAAASYNMMQGSGVVTDAHAGYFGFYSGSSFVNSYGVYIGTIHGTNKYSLYSSDSSTQSYIAGSLGVGSTAPAAKFEIKGANANSTGTPLFKISDTAIASTHFAVDNGNLGGQYRIMAFGSDLQIQSGSTTTMQLKTNGRVGIGTLNPGSLVHIDGSGAGKGLCVTDDGICNVTPNGGEISSKLSLVTGADYAEYFEAEEKLNPGEVVGLNGETGKARGYKVGDKLLGIVSSDPGVVGNSKLSIGENAILVALLGQVPFEKEQVIEKNSMVYTLDNKPIGYLLSSGNVYLNLSTGSEDEVQNQKISQVQKLLQEKLSEIESLKNKNEDLEVRLHRLEGMLSK